MTDTKQITVKELIEQLQALPQDALVDTEGCDCHGPCSGVELIPPCKLLGETEATVLICRGQ